ncbi:DEAD/DEAH box helicase [Bosea vaviloviae]|uniref:Helicase ATP-binding domain-containing protein n=1 Tax=Bosea vaviloviae TaxID=1526658 RepID=A0A0N1N0I3_9HYPH|nr:DEAD/DEAH box helicase [Bosea vaviloviae]KPH79339.1 hypothetical protein AE618_18735 [Bosea vaviloviae]
MRPLRPHQVRALDLLRHSLGSGNRRPMLAMPTGAGKTLLAAAIVEGALSKRKTVTFCVPALSLVDQTVEAFWAEGIRDVGVIQGKHERTSAFRPVQIASVQTLMRRDIPDSDVVVIDEAHRWFDFYGDWMAKPEWARVPFIGLSATPWTKGLGKFFDDLIVPTTMAELMEAGFLTKFRVFAPSHPDLTGVRTVAGDYHDGDLSEAMDKPKLTADVVETWRRLGEDRQTFVFGVDRAHAKHLQERFLEAGIAAAYVDAFTEMEERNDIRKQFHDGRCKVVCNVGTMTTGVDWDVRCIVLARPTKSEMLYLQIIGRGLRAADGKDDLLIIDHSDTTLNLGFVTDVHHAKLDDGSPRPKRDRVRKTPEPKECGKCSFLKPAKVHQCPSCGFAPVQVSSIACDDGQIDVLSHAKVKAAAEQKRRFYAELTGYAEMHGKSPKWVLANYRAKFDEWPYRREVTPQNPSPETLGWVKSRQIAWAKSRHKSEGAAA